MWHDLSEHFLKDLGRRQLSPWAASGSFVEGRNLRVSVRSFVASHRSVVTSEEVARRQTSSELQEKTQHLHPMRTVVSAADASLHPIVRAQEKISDLRPHCCGAKNQEILSRQMFCLDSTVSFLQLRTAAMRLNGTTTVSVEFEVRGELQGLYFLKHCREEATNLGICGWVKRDRRGAIMGVIQGQRSRIEQMICWLSCRGSPGSRIDECRLDNYRYMPRPEYRSFSVRY